MENVTPAQIYERLVAVEAKVDHIDKNTKDLIDGFNAVQGAFTVLGWIAKIAKPILWIAAAWAATALFFASWRK